MSDSAPTVSLSSGPAPHAVAKPTAELHAHAPISRRKEIRNGLLCALATAAAMLASLPFAETGFQDDWSYIHTALDFARTGHFIYNGWTTAMLGWIIPWSALFIKLFGFSFTLTRATLLPFDLATVYILHATLVRFEVRGRAAIFGALTFGLSPLFLPLATSYMTDVAGVFVIVLCLYCCRRACDAATDRAELLWLITAATTNILGGTVRQISWLGALVMVPSTAWLLRRRSHMLRTAAVLWLVSIASVAALLHWWNLQPYSVPEHIDQGAVTTLLIHHMLGALTKGIFCVLLLLFPVLALWLSPTRFRTRNAAITVGTGVLLVAIAILITQRFIPDAWLIPWLTHIIQSDMRGSGEFPGVVEISWPVWLRELLSVAILSSAVACLLQRFVFKRPSDPPHSSRPIHHHGELFWLLGPFTIAYIALLAPRALYALIYDRYFLGLMPMGIIVLLRWNKRLNRSTIPAAGWIVLALYAAFAIASTHDWYAVLRARLAAVRAVETAGFPRTRIQGAFELDGWIEIEAAGYVNEKRIENPPHAFHENMRLYTMPEPCRHFFGWYAPHIHPLYTVALTKDDCFLPTAFPPVPFTKWLPPFHGAIYTRRWKPNYE